MKILPQTIYGMKSLMVYREYKLCYNNKINKDFYFQLQNSTRGMAVRTVAGLYVETQY